MNELNLALHDNLKSLQQVQCATKLTRKSVFHKHMCIGESKFPF